MLYVLQENNRENGPYNISLPLLAGNGKAEKLGHDVMMGLVPREKKVGEVLIADANAWEAFIKMA